MVQTQSCFMSGKGVFFGSTNLNTYMLLGFNPSSYTVNPGPTAAVFSKHLSLGFSHPYENQCVPQPQVAKTPGTSATCFLSSYWFKMAQSCDGLPARASACLFRLEGSLMCGGLHSLPLTPQPFSLIRKLSS